MISKANGERCRDDRAVSEVLGFAMVFFVVIAAVGVLYLTGFGAMADYQEAERSANVDFAMDALAENFNDVLKSEGVFQRSGEINPRGGLISSTDDGPIEEIWIDDDEVLEDHLDRSGLDGIGAFTYTDDDATSVYQGGGVFKRGPGGDAVVIREPPVRCLEDEAAVVSIATVYGTDGTISADGNREISVEKRGTTTVEMGDTVEIVIDADADFSDAWATALENRGFTGDNDGELFRCEADDSVVLRLTTLQISYD